MALNFFKAGNWTFDDASKPIVLGNFLTTTVTQGNYQSMYKQTGSAQGGVLYQVTAGKTLYITLLLYCPSSASASIQLGYADNGVDNTAGGGMTNNRFSSGLIEGGAVAHVIVTVPLFIPIPAAKYPWINANAGTNPAVTMIGYEV